MALVRYRTNDYSVPVEWGHREVMVKGFVHEVVICAASEVIARHPRSYEREDMVFDPLHYLALLEQKPNALDQAAPLAGWNLPEGFAQLRRLMEARLGKKGKREYVQTLRLLETFPMAEVEQAIDGAKHEARELDLKAEPSLCRDHGLTFRSFPIADRGTPTPSTGRELDALLAQLHAELLQGQAVAIHCRAGIGRTGLVAGCLLHLLGVPYHDIFHLLSRSRGVAMPDTAAQVEWVERFARRQGS